MSDIIKLLPDSVANQIAAGEVIQRPASVVKELLENALDAGATHINLIIKDAGRTLIQITDNGHGMSATDARMCFEKHATSKITKPEDLFKLNTLGFRGEALSSIAAISHVQLKTKLEANDLGTEIIIEGSVLKSQENCTTSTGTSFSIKNLFYNVPARRNFLKSNTAELRHIIEEFQRVAMVNPETAFTFYNNGNILYQLSEGSLKQRITQCIGTKNYEEKLVPIEEQTDSLKVSGYIGKPEFARKKRGEQYFFANNRFIKHPYFHHAIENAYRELIPDGSHPSYFIYLEVNPEDIDVNIHPTKIEVNFSDKQLIYAVIAAAAKRALGQFNLIPSLDFNQEASLNFQFDENRPIKAPSIKINPDFNPFDSPEQEKSSREINNQDNWSKLYDFDKQTDFKPQNNPEFNLDYSNDNRNQHTESDTVIQSSMSSLDSTTEDNKSIQNDTKSFIQLAKSYIITTLKSGLIIINQKLAHERILYERYLEQYENRMIASQQLLFPVNINLTIKELSIIKEIESDLKNFGFEFEYFSKSGIVINGSPMDMSESRIPSLLDEILSRFQEGEALDTERKLVFARSMAHQLCIKLGQKLEKSEMEELTDALFSCHIPDISIDGEQIIKTISLREIQDKFLS